MQQKWYTVFPRNYTNTILKITFCDNVKERIDTRFEQTCRINNRNKVMTIHNTHRLKFYHNLFYATPSLKNFVHQEHIHQFNKDVNFGDCKINYEAILNKI